MTEEEFKLAEEEMLKEFENSFAKQKGAKLPKEKKSKYWYVLVYLYWNQNVVVTKKELTQFLTTTFGLVGDVQQARHLQQYGLRVLQHRDPYKERKLKKGEYTFLGFDTIDPHFNFSRKEINLDWESIKEKFMFHCATCGSKENEKQRFTGEIVKLEKGHKDPRKQMTNDNIIPQCGYCNKKYKDKVVFDDCGQVYKVLTQDMVDVTI